jgi:small multidrug resistance pump
MKWVFLFSAIVFEVIGTSALKYSNGFRNVVPSIIAVIAYGLCFFFLSQTLKSIPVGIAYAVWSGVGIFLISIIGVFIFKQQLDFPAIIGLSLIISGVVVINIFSKSIPH